MTPELRERLAQIRLLALDVDGVLTDGTLYYGEHGEALKAFHARDGVGMKLLQKSGVEIAVISARRSAALERRLADLGIRHAHLGSDDKLAALETLLQTLALSPEQVAYAGDDVIDLPVLRRAGVAIAVSDAVPEVVAEAHWVTRSAGGRGAVREMCDAIIESRQR